MSRLARSFAPLAALAVALLGLPEAAAACSVCYGGGEESRKAFLFTTVLLSLLPISMIGGFGWWVWRHLREDEPAAISADSKAKSR
jgi:di/tricarboxylate transporter